MHLTHWNACIVAGFALLLVGCGTPTLPGDDGPSIKFKDQAESNTQTKSAELGDLSFVDSVGKQVDLAAYRGKSNLVLVVTRGLVGTEKPNATPSPYDGNICTFCSTQTSRLIANYSKFKQRNAEVLVVFPIARKSDSGRLEKFAARVQGAGKTAAAAPFPLLLDVDLRAVDALGIRADLSKPATYILDKQGEVRFAYVGQSLSDRPSVKALLDQLDQINAE
ncbi:MAG: redoxin domain-containing protein [Pirellulaceae bacterium]|nr:redoxin domain-containing protein [Pirellulaceae bacterium]